MGTLTISKAIFNSYAQLPEGNSGELSKTIEIYLWKMVI